MKIQRPNQTHLNVYNNQMKKHQQKQEHIDQKDQLHISSEAKQLQKGVKSNQSRLNHIENIKDRIQSGEYEIDYNETAKKMMDFWLKHS